MSLLEPLLPQLDPYLHRLATEQAVFSYDELCELCEERLLVMWSKTKEANKLPILLKYLSTMFEIDLLEQSKPQLTKRFTTLPKWLLQSSKDTSNQPIIQITNLSKQIWSTLLFEDASIQLIAGSKTALIGKNGAGKSTLLKMLIWREELDNGEITLPKNTSVGFLSQEIFREAADRTVLEEMRATLPEITSRIEQLDLIDRRIAAHDPDSVTLLDQQADITERLVLHNGFVLYDLQTSILQAFWFTDAHLSLHLHQLSWGEQTKVQIAKFLLQQVDLLVLDEPTNHLDIEGIIFLESFCRARGKTLLCISHDKRFLNTVFDQVIEIADHQLFLYKGNYDDYIDQKIALYEQQQKNFKNQQKYLEQQEAFINRFRYKASKASQVQSRIKLLDKVDKLDAPENMHTAKQITLRRHDKRLPETILTIHDGCVGYTTPLITLPKKLVVTKTMQVGIIGKNGVGKTTLINGVLWIHPLLAGTCTLYPQLIVGSYGQIVESMHPDKTIVDELVGPWASMKEVLGMLGSLSIDAQKVTQRIGTLSGGEKAKVALTKMMLGKPDVIIMDEPTNHLDLLTKESITMMLQEFTGVSIIISHDREFLSQVSNILWVVDNNTLTVCEDIEKGFALLW